MRAFFDLFHEEGNHLQILLLRGVAVEYLVTTGARGELVDRLVVVFEGLAVEGDGGSSGFASLQGELLETLQTLDGRIGIVEGLDVDLNRLCAFALAGIGDGNGEGDLAVLVYRRG